MSEVLRRQFWLTLLVFLLLTMSALGLSRLYVEVRRVDYSHAQAMFFAELALGREGDPVEAISEMETHSRALGLPFDFEIIDAATAPLAKPEEFRREIHRAPGQLLSVTVRPPPTLRFTLAVTFVAIFLASVLGTFLSIYLLQRRMRDKAELAKNVFRRIQGGDLRVRFPVSKLDEFAQVLVVFNQMADEIEKLVSQLKAKETARTQLLQELAHDLRTPLASLRNLVESVRFAGAEMRAGDRDELLNMAFEESEYMTTLVEDLLFLALVLEPEHARASSAVDVSELLGSLLGTVSRAFDRKAYVFNEREGCWVKGDPQQLRRLLRNALDNAFSFAEREVRVDVHEGRDHFDITIQDDGPGFNEEALRNFGRKRETRYHALRGQKRLSVGLGSVIMNAIASRHGGRLRAENASRGSRLTITLPKADLPG